MRNPFSKSDSIKTNQQRLFFMLDGLVSIAKVKIEREDNNSVNEMLNDLEFTFDKFWELKKINPAKFDALLWSPTFYNEYVAPLQEGRLPNQSSGEKTDDLQVRRALKLAFGAQRELTGLTQFLNSFKKIWKCAIRNNNEEISSSVFFHIIRLLRNLTITPGKFLICDRIPEFECRLDN